MTEYQEQLILKFLNETISTDEQTALQAWINESADNRKLMDDFSLMWKESKGESKPLDFETTDEWKKFEKFINKSEHTKSRILDVNSHAYGLKIAASILVIALFSWVLYLILFNAETILKESGNAVVQVALPDGSKVWLNQDSRIAYQHNFSPGKRVIKLVGEAFFDIKKDSRRPFIIQTAQAQIKVMGTTFNVQAYEDTNTTEVYVESGLVNFSSIKNKSDGITLNRGETGTLTRKSKVVVLNAEENLNAVAWKERKLVFSKSPIPTVVKSLEEYFNVEIEIRNKNILRCRFTGSFNQPTLEEIIEALSVSLELTISKTEDAFIIDGGGC